MIDLWRKAWLDRLCSQIACPSARILEYGIGGGLLGQYLLTTGNASFYVGLDISPRQLESARSRLQKQRVSNFQLASSSSDFAAFRPDVFVSQVYSPRDTFAPVSANEWR